jgi:hypothetical protein
MIAVRRPSAETLVTELMRRTGELPNASTGRVRRWSDSRFHRHLGRLSHRTIIVTTDRLRDERTTAARPSPTD